MTSTSSTGEGGHIVEPQMMCEACARMLLAGTEWHSLFQGLFSREECSHTEEGPGYWVCGDCHEIIHEWMDRNPYAEHPSKESLQRIFKGLAKIVEGPPRKYQRTTGQDTSENEPLSGEGDETNT